MSGKDNQLNSKVAATEESKAYASDATSKPGESKVAPEEEKAKVVNPTRKLMKYVRLELKLFVIGSIALLGGSLGELINPYYIGMFVDNLNAK